MRGNSNKYTSNKALFMRRKAWLKKPFMGCYFWREIFLLWAYPSNRLKYHHTYNFVTHIWIVIEILTSMSDLSLLYQNCNCIFQNTAIVLLYKEHIWLMNGFPNMYAVVLFIEQFFCSRNRKSFRFSWGNVYCKIIMHDNGR